MGVRRSYRRGGGREQARRWPPIKTKKAPQQGEKVAKRPPHGEKGPLLGEKSIEMPHTVKKAHHKEENVAKRPPHGENVAKSPPPPI